MEQPSDLLRDILGTLDNHPKETIDYIYSELCKAIIITAIKLIKESANAGMNTEDTKNSLLRHLNGQFERIYQANRMKGMFHVEHSKNPQQPQQPKLTTKLTIV